MAGAGISGLAVFYSVAGGILLWSGLKGSSVKDTVQAIVSGNLSTLSDTQTVGGPSIGVSSGSGSSSSGSGTTSTGSGSSDSSSGATPSATSSSAQEALNQAATAYGWNTGAEWAALVSVEMREAGFDITATNPSSGAYGLAQFINGPDEYYQYGGNPNTAAGQAVAMINYIKQRYGTPEAAAQHEDDYGWY